MKITKRFCWVGLTVAVVAGVVRGADLEWRPIDATGAHTIVGNDITLQGTGQQVTLDLRVSNWDPDMDGIPDLGLVQGALDPASYTTGSGVALAPFGTCTVSGALCDPFDAAACNNGADGTCDATAGAFQIFKRCTIGFFPDINGAPCLTIADCPGEVCVDNPDFVFTGFSPGAALATGTLGYEYLAFAGLGAVAGRTDDGNSFHVGILIVNVPAGAQGTYTISLNPDPNATFLLDFGASGITPLNLIPTRITIACQTNLDCDDGNACTDDVCNPATNTCTNAINFNDAVFCCTPSDRTLTQIDDMNDCTNDVCDSATGIVTHPLFPAGTACGDPTTTECDAPDSCDGAGTCLAKIRPAGTSCGDPASTECNGADACNGNGSCQPNFALPGTACGDPTMSACTNPDTCNGAGNCLANDAPNGSACDDGLFCNVGEACAGGACAGGTPRNCDDGLSCTTDSCNEAALQCDNVLLAGNCLIGGVCFADMALNPANDCQSCNPSLVTNDWTLLPSGTTCNDGDPCTGTGRPGVGVDTCDGAGICAGVPDPQCNDDCAFAIPASEGSTTSNNNNVGPDDAEASCQPISNGDVWFVYTASCNGDVFLGTTGTMLTPSNDPVLSVYDACPNVGGAEIACDDDSGVNLQAALTFTATAGMDYLIRVAGFENNTGTIVLNIAPVNNCLINGTCFTSGTVNPENECEACIPVLSTSGWSARAEGTACGDPSDTECDAPDACNGVGLCETNPKPDGTACTDDANQCTFDFCNTGACTHPPVPVDTPCGDPSVLQCDNPDSCDGMGLCLKNFQPLGLPCGDPFDEQCNHPDFCDGSGGCDPSLEPNGTACNDGDICTGSDSCTAGTCAGTLIAQAPVVEQDGPRAIAVTPTPAGSPAPIALRFTSPDFPCLDKFIQLDGTLGTTSAFQLTDDWATVAVTGMDMVPSTRYVVEAVCGSFTSAPGSNSTCIHCDINCDGMMNGNDILLQVTGFQGDFSLGVSKEAMDVEPCTPNNLINGNDILRCVLAFRGQTFVASGCPLPCP